MTELLRAWQGRAGREVVHRINASTADSDSYAVEGVKGGGQWGDKGSKSKGEIEGF